MCGSSSVWAGPRCWSPTWRTFRPPKPSLSLVPICAISDVEAADNFVIVVEWLKVSEQTYTGGLMIHGVFFFFFDGLMIHGVALS